MFHRARERERESEREREREREELSQRAVSLSYMVFDTFVIV